MTESILLVGYEINAQLAKDKIQKSKGLMNRLKKTHSSEVVSHVANAWNDLESILKSEGHYCENKVLYTAQLSAFSEVKSNATTIVNNSFLLSIITADEDSKFEAVKNERYVAYSKASEFEQHQFSIYLSEIEENFESQEVGLFGWLRIPTDDLAKIQKRVASSFPTNVGGELHFFEFHTDGSIFPNFADVETQRFEGKLAGNYALKFDAKSCQRGIADLNEITVRLFNVKVVEFGLPNQVERQHTEAASGQASVPAPKAKNKYSEEFKRQVAEASLVEGRTLKSVADEFGISATLVRNWQLKFLQQNEKSEIESMPSTGSDDLGDSTEMSKTAKPSDEQLQELFEAKEEALDDKATFATLVSDAGGNLYNVQLDVEFNDDGTWDFIARLICAEVVSLSDNAKEIIEDKLEEIGDELYHDFEKYGLDPQLKADYRVEITTE